MRSVMFLFWGLGCGGTDASLRSDVVTANEPDPTVKPEPKPEPKPEVGAAVVLDDVRIAGLLEDAHAFSLLGTVVNPLLAEQIDAGTLLLGLEFRSVDDPEFQSDDDMSVGLYLLDDEDDDPTDNFDPERPETFGLGPGAQVDGEPVLHFVDASLTNGRLEASGLGALELIGDAFPLPLSNLTISGDLTVQDGTVRTLEDGRLRGALGMSLLALTPNPLGENCGSGSLLDVLATGCGFFGLQPDEDIDGDGLERLFDDDDDGVIDRCVDGDDTEILGTDCPFNPAMADGYTLIFVITGVQAELVAPTE